MGRQVEDTAQATHGQPGPEPARGSFWRWRPQVLVASVLAIGLLVFVFIYLFRHWLYPLHYLTDLPVDYGYARAFAGGLAPYRGFHPEYPPLALWLMVAPALSGGLRALTFAAYEHHFGREMLVFAAIAAASVAFTADRLWRQTRRTYLTALTFVALIIAVGPLVANRFDLSVATVVGLVLLALATDEMQLAGFFVGVGFALKLTPITLLPLVLFLAGWNRRALSALLLCVAGAVTPFVPYLLAAHRGVAHSFTYQLHRPLEIESVLGLPIIERYLLGHAVIGRYLSHHSWTLSGAGTHLAAQLPHVLTAAALVVVTGLVWRRRASIRRDRRKLPLAVLAFLLAVLCWSDVLSPQYIIWLLPAIALVICDDLPLGLLLVGTCALTQVEFPLGFVGILSLHAANLAWLCLRNACLVLAFALALWRLWRLPPAAATESDNAPSADLRARAFGEGDPPLSRPWSGVPVVLSKAATVVLATILALAIALTAAVAVQALGDVGSLKLLGRPPIVHGAGHRESIVLPGHGRRPDHRQSPRRLRERGAAAAPAETAGTVRPVADG